MNPSQDLSISREQEQRALDLYSDAIIVDGSTIIKYEDGYFDRARKSGVTAANHTTSSDSFRSSVGDMAECYSWIERSSERGYVALSVEDIERAKKEKKTSVIFGPQNATLIEDDIRLLRIVHKLGTRIIQLTYQERNLLGDGCGERNASGLTAFGADVVKEMNRLGIVIDLSHCGVQTVNDAMELSQDPVIYSHSNPYSLCKLPGRAKTDDQIKALAEKRGVIGITAYSSLCKTKTGVQPTLEDLLTHIDYVANLVGVDYVGIGLDLDETWSPESWNNFRSSYPELCDNWQFEESFVKGMLTTDQKPFLDITKGLVARGYSDDEVKKILGENFLRVFRRVWGS